MIEAPHFVCLLAAFAGPIAIFAAGFFGNVAILECELAEISGGAL